MFVIKKPFKDKHGDEVGALLSHYDTECEMLIFIRNPIMEQTKKGLMNFESKDTGDQFIKDNDLQGCETIELD